jgi:hypothetical protein
VQGTLSAAAREGARTMALQNDPAATRSSVRTAAAVLNPGVTDGQITITAPATCPTTGAPVTVTVRYTMPFVSGWFGSGITLPGKGVMRCNG